MNNAAACTERSPSKGNPLAMLQGVGGRIADSLKRTVTTNAATMFAGLSMLATATPAFAGDVTMRNTIGGVRDATLDSVSQAGVQVTTIAPNGPRISPSGITLDLPPNSKCQLKSLSFVFGCKSGIATPGTDLYSDRQLFNGTGTFKFIVHSGPVEALAGRTEGDIYNETLTPTTFSSVMPWGTTTNNPYSLTKVLPLYHGTISLTGVPTIETGSQGKRVFIKIFTLSDDYSKQTRFALMYAKGATEIQDVGVSTTEAHYVTEATTHINSTAFATEFIVGVEPLTATAPTCSFEKINDKWALCWPASYGTNYVVQMIGSLSQTTQLGFMWEDFAVAPALSATDAKYCVDIPTNSPTAFFRLRSR